MGKTRGSCRNSKWTVLTGLFGCILLILSMFGQLSAQDLRGKVYSLDEKGDTVPVYMAKLQWLHTGVGTYTNPRGAYKLPYAKTDTLIVSYSFYKTDTLLVKKGSRGGA